MVLPEDTARRRGHLRRAGRRRSGRVPALRLTRKRAPRRPPPAPPPLGLGVTEAAKARGSGHGGRSGLGVTGPWGHRPKRAPRRPPPEPPPPGSGGAPAKARAAANAAMGSPAHGVTGRTATPPSAFVFEGAVADRRLLARSPIGDFLVSQAAAATAARRAAIARCRASCTAERSCVKAATLTSSTRGNGSSAALIRAATSAASRMVRKPLPG